MASSSSVLVHPLRKHCIAVIGTTGVGKSDFAIQLAKLGKGAIINSDALQIYQGLDILTNKVPLHQQNGIPHHVLSLQPMTEPTFTVINFERIALNLINQLQSSNTLPIIVGGTHYYLQYLLFGNQDSSSFFTSNQPLSSTSVIPNLEEYSPSQLYQHLLQVSPSLAAKWHPNDTRRIKRVLEKWYSNPSLSSSSSLSSSLSSLSPSSFSSWSTPSDPVQPKFPCLIFWLYLPFSKLDPKLDQRVNEMLQQGLLSEIQSIRHLKNLQKERGIYQAIGCKEWEPYFEALDQGNLDLANSKYAECLEAMKIATKRYARKQLTWIRNKLWPLCQASFSSSSCSSSSNQVYVYVLDASQPNIPQVMTIVQAFLENKVSELPCPETLNPIATEVFALLKEKKSNISSTEWRKYTCDYCERELNGEHEWMIHLSSKSHRRRLKYISLLHTKQQELVHCLETYLNEKKIGTETSIR